MSPYIQTYTGRIIDVFDPKEEDIDILDIAHGLAMKCRYNGHTSTFYSVAEHCVRMCLWNLPGNQSAKLLHDAAEAYLPDMPTPIKQRLNGFHEIETNLLNIIFKKFGLVVYNQEEVKIADQIMLATEARDLMGNPQDWELQQEPYHHHIEPWNWEMAEASFLYYAKELKIV
jgi:hypothetical protein